MSGNLVFCVFVICLLCVTLAEAIGFKVNGDVLQIESDSQGQLYPHRTEMKYDGVYRKSLKVDSSLRLSNDNQHKKRFLMADWILMMKGVSGAPGPDLFQLWQSNATLNTILPLANRLTSEFNGHYKPDYSNHWADYCIDQVKVSIYNNGVEKAFIVFDARGTDKMGWFADSRIIRSSWADLTSTKKEMVSMAGNTQTGQEFSIVGHTAASSSCDSFGWFMVSTKATCFFEMGDSKPTFYYAPGTSLAHWGFVNPGSGDVFAIHAHKTCSPSPTTVAPPTTQATSSCSFRGRDYRQGETWKDGCSQKCTCSHAASGTYTCRDLCLTWHGSPQCHLLPAPPGLCCEQMFCPSGNISIPLAYRDEYPLTANSKYSYV